MGTRGYPSSLALVFCAGICWSTQGLAVRLIEDADAWQILFFRSIALTGFLALVLGVRYGPRVYAAVRTSGAPGVVGGVLLVFAYVFAILAMQKTSIADAVLLFATAPFFAAVLGWVLLRERVGKSTWIAICFALVGILVMQRGAIATGNAIGNIYAIGSALCFALFTLVLRWRSQSDMMPTVLLSGVFATFACFIVIQANGSGFDLPAGDVVVASLMGVFQTGAGLVLYTIGARNVPAVQLALLPLIEVVLSPFWVAVFVGEMPTSTVLVGGLFVGVAIVSDAVLIARRRTKEALA